jgi:protein NrfD
VSSPSSRPNQYGRHTDRAPGERTRSGQQSDREFRPYRGESYYELPVVKASPWGWLIATYFFVGGLAGAAQMIAQIAALLGGPSQRPVVTAGRFLAFAGVFASPILLILDLHTPSRWYNMLRIARRTSPMSIGSGILTGFGASTLLAAAAHVIGLRFASGRVSSIEHLAGTAGALTGAAMSTYTATLLSSTSIPLWLTSARHLPILFGSTAMASAIAAIGLTLDATSRSSDRRPLSLLGLLASAVQLWSTREVEQDWAKHRLHSPKRDPSMHRVDTLLVKGAGVMVPAAVQLTIVMTGRAPKPLSAVASVATLVGALAERWLIVAAGNQSASRPTDYFQISQPSSQVNR